MRPNRIRRAIRAAAVAFITIAAISLVLNRGEGYVLATLVWVVAIDVWIRAGMAYKEE